MEVWKFNKRAMFEIELEIWWEDLRQVEGLLSSKKICFWYLLATARPPIKGPKSRDFFFFFFLTKTEEAPKFQQLNCQHHSRCGPHHEQDYNLQCQPHKSISVVHFWNLNPFRFDFSLSGGRVSQWTVKMILFSDIIICFYIINLLCFSQPWYSANAWALVALRGFEFHRSASVIKLWG